MISLVSRLQILLGTFLVFAASFGVATAQEVVTMNPENTDPVIVHMFTRDDCKFCVDQKAFLEDLATKRFDFTIEYHDLANKLDQQLFVQFTEARDLPKVTPLTVIGRTILQGFDSPEGTGLRIISAIERTKTDPPVSLETVMISGPGDVVGNIENGCEGEVCDVTAGPGGFILKLPFLGVVDLTKYSLPVLAAILGFIDGFNPCAMWVLITFLLVLMQIGNKKKMFQVAGLFLVAEAITYTLILNVWYHTWDFVGLDQIVTPLVGLLAVGAGIFFIVRWWKKRNAPLVCDVTSIDQQTKIETKIHEFAKAPMTIAVGFGIIGLALSVNVIEFACSIGIPQAFTKILELNQLSFWTNQMYMGIYILMYMVDDLIVFAVALWGFSKLHAAGEKYSRLSLIIGGILMLILGVLLLFAPDMLVL